MRWDRLFEDLEAMWDAAEAADRESELPELVRAERADIVLAGRLRHHRGRTVSLVAGPHPCRGVVLGVGSQWMVLDETDASGRTSGAQMIVPLAAIAFVRDLPVHSVDEDALLARLPLGHVFRALSRDRSVVQIGMLGAAPGVVGDTAGVINGTIDRVARDHCDVALHPADEARRGRSVTGRLSLPFGSIAFVRSL